MSETKYVRILQITALLTLVGTAAPSAMAGKPSSGIVVDCVGDSITAGYNLAGNQSYPSQLAGMLGSNYIVNNFGVSSTTMLKNGNYSYWGTRTYSNSLRSSPKYVIIAFGTNDSKSYNWDTHGGEFVGDYQSMISSYATLNSQPTVFVTYITPYYLPNPWPSDFPDPARIPNLIIPAIQQVVTSTGSPSIDDYNPFVNQPQLFGSERRVHQRWQRSGWRSNRQRRGVGLRCQLEYLLRCGTGFRRVDGDRSGSHQYEVGSRDLLFTKGGL
jgi:hypothetical protein